MTIFEQTISAFKNARDTHPVNVSLRAFLRDTKRREQIQSLRAEQDKKQRDILKKELPAATISGRFVKREMAGIEHYNGLICLDFDAADNPSIDAEAMKRKLGEFDEVAYAGLSVSGKGVFAIVPTDLNDPADHSDAVGILGEIFRQHGLIYDKCCKDVCRLRFISYDPDAVWRDQAPAFAAGKWLEQIREREIGRPQRPLRIKQYEPAANDTTRKKVEQYIEVIEGSCVDVTESYQDWYQIGMAFASEFGRDGEDYFHRISKFSPKYDYAQTEKKYKQLVAGASGRVKIGTFFHILNQNGIRL